MPDCCSGNCCQKWRPSCARMRRRDGGNGVSPSLARDAKRGYCQILAVHVEQITQNQARCNQRHGQRGCSTPGSMPRHRKMITDIKKNEFLGKLAANQPQQVSLPVVHAIVQHVHPILGVACARYEEYAEVSATGLRTVARTIPALERHGLVRKRPRRHEPPVLWLPEMMDMQADEALRRAGWLARHKDDNPQNYFRGANANIPSRAHARRASERAREEIDVEGERRRKERCQSLAGYRDATRSGASTAAQKPSHLVIKKYYF